jgi:hypothetical protein
VLHLAETPDETANRACLVRAALVERARIREEERIENYTGEDAAGER